MKFIWHHNTWPWGRTVRIISADGMAIVEMSFENDNAGICFLSGLSVAEPQRRKGIATQLMLTCESYCRANGIFRIDLLSVLTDWVQDFYKKCGYVPIKEDDGFMRMYKLLYEEKPKVVDGVVHHALKSHWIVTDKNKLAAILKEFPEGAEVELFVCAKMGEKWR